MYSKIGNCYTIFANILVRLCILLPGTRPVFRFFLFVCNIVFCFFFLFVCHVFRLCDVTNGFLLFSYDYLGESEVLQYFGKLQHNTTAPNAFTEDVKVTNQTGQLDADFTRYFPSVTRRICLYGLGHCIRIPGCRPT